MANWNEVAHRMVRAEMVRKGLTYADLVERLKPLGVDDNERNIRNKVARGTFSGVFLIQCLAALGVETIDLKAYDIPYETPETRALREQYAHMLDKIEDS